MTIRVGRRSTIALATAGAVASTGTAYLSARNLLITQATQARTVIPKAWDVPPRADGIYSPDGGPVQRWHRGVPFDLSFMIFGDSTATGYGCESAEEVPGVLIARGLAARTGKRIRLSTKAIVGATSKGVCGQVDAMFVAGPPPDVAVMMLGANDITALNGITQSARRLELTVRKLRTRGAVVVVGTCPDLGIITAIPQPLRSLAHARGSQLARAQAGAVRAAGGIPVPLATLLAPQFRALGDAMFSADRFHPSAPAYALAAEQLLLTLCSALAHQAESPQPTPEPAAEAAEAARARLGAVTRLWRREVPGREVPGDGATVPTAG